MKIRCPLSELSKRLALLSVFFMFVPGKPQGVSSQAQIVYEIDAGKTVGKNSRFWQAAGHDFLFQLVHEPAGQELLDRMKQNGSCTYFRTHYTFSNNTDKDKLAGGSIGGNVLVIDDRGRFHYDFSKVNRTFSEYVRRGMKPIVEFDFFPDRMAGNLNGTVNDERFGSRQGAPKDWQSWEDLLRRFMRNLVDTFGKDELRTWYFEVWNEPDSWPRKDLRVFFKLYDLFAEVVKSYDAHFKVGGPGCYHVYFLRDFLEHVVNGTNEVTGKKGAPVDFISYHLYGLSGTWLEKPLMIRPEVQRFTVELLWIERLLKEYQNGLRDAEFHLNEWGLCSHFERTSLQWPQLVYRDDETAPLFLTKLVDCLYALEDRYRFKTSLMLYWGFCWEAKQEKLFIGHRELTTAGNIPKPMLTGYEMLAKLGSDRLAVTGPAPGGRTGMLATRSSNRDVQFLVYNFCETDDDPDHSDAIEIRWTNLSGKRMTAEMYELDREHNNTFRTWQNLGKPETLTETIRETLVKAGTLSVTSLENVNIENGRARIRMNLPRHSMRLFCAKMQ